MPTVQAIDKYDIIRFNMSFEQSRYSLENQRASRQLILPATINLYLSQALNDAPLHPTEPGNIYIYDTQRLEELNSCPALTATFGVFQRATIGLEDCTMLGSILTTDQQELLQDNIDWSACSPDHNFKHNFMTTYPVFALGFLHEAFYSGMLPIPQTVHELLTAFKDMKFENMMYEGMVGASGSWQQTCFTMPCGVFERFRDLYDYGVEAPFTVNEKGEYSLKQAITDVLTREMRERNRTHIQVAAGCPILIQTLHGISSDPTDPKYLSREQLEGLLISKNYSDPIAESDENGVIRINWEVLKRLKDYYYEFATNYVSQFGAPSLSETRPNPHKSTYVQVTGDQIIQPATRPELRVDCPQSNIDSKNWETYKIPCNCAD